MGDEEQTKLCTNCQRDIPAANFTIHEVHCSRNIKVCPNCRDPVPISDMKEHLKHVRCSECGDAMQACDLGAHKREACPETAVPCPYCTLGLPRSLMADHEAYCGARTERCLDCKELVMIKYKKLHEESNHGFIKLDDEPGPQPSWNPSKVSAAPSASTISFPAVRNLAPSNSMFKISSHQDTASSSAPVRCTVIDSPRGFVNSRSADVVTDGPVSFPRRPSKEENVSVENLDLIERERRLNQVIEKKQNSRLKQNMIRPDQLDLTAGHQGASQNKPSTSKGAVKKYPAPQPPPSILKQSKESDESPQFPASLQGGFSVKNPPSFNPVRNLPMYSALLREQNQIKERNALNEFNQQNDLPLVLNPAEKLEKLRKLDRLNARDELPSENSKKQKKKPKNIPDNDFKYTPMTNNELTKRLQKISKECENKKGLHKENGVVRGLNKNEIVSRLGNDGVHEYETINYDRWTPPAETAVQASPPSQQVDRFMEIKNDLRVLRKELKECSSPLEVRKSANTTNNGSENVARNVNVPRPGPLQGNSIWNQDGSRPPPSRAKEDLRRTPEDNLRRDIVPHNQRRNIEKNHLTRNKDCNKANELSGALARDEGAAASAAMLWDRNNCSAEGQAGVRATNPWDAADDIMLPCESCQTMVPAQRLVDHELLCQRSAEDGSNEAASEGARPRKSPPGGKKPSPHKIHRHHTSLEQHQASINQFNNVGPEDMNGVLLPCEFCHQMIPAKFFITHETGCNPLATSILPPSRANFSNDLASPDNNPNDSGVLVPKTSNLQQNRLPLAVVVPSPPKQRDRRAPSPLGDASEDGDEVRLPCEFCMSLVPASRLMLHQEECFNE